MSNSLLAGYLDHIRRAATDARGFVDGLSKDDFLADKRTQNAVVMCLIIIGEAAAKIMDRFAAFARSNPTVPWQSKRGMRNRIAHGYFDIDLNIVWETVQTALPALLQHLAEAPCVTETGGNHE